MEQHSAFMIKITQLHAMLLHTHGSQELDAR